jgi:hypothetical protein
MKSVEHKVKARNLFDLVNGALIPVCPKLFNVPSKLINITLQHTKINGTLTGHFCSAM